jgi:hypothetical protein
MFGEGIFIRVFEFAVPRFMQPLKVEVQSLDYQTGENDPDAMVISTHPRRYFAHLRLTNRTASQVVVQHVTLTINDHTLTAEDKLQLGPRDCVKHAATFSVNRDDEALENGRFQLTVKPTSGRATRVSGQFPL